MKKRLFVLFVFLSVFLSFFYKHCSASELLKIGVCELTYNRMSADFAKDELDGCVLKTIAAEISPAVFPVAVKDKAAFFYLKEGELFDFARFSGADKLIVPHVYQMNAGLIVNIKIIDCKTGLIEANYFSSCLNTNVSETLIMTAKRTCLTLKLQADENIIVPSLERVGSTPAGNVFSPAPEFEIISLGKGASINNASDKFSISFAPDSQNDRKHSVFGVFLISRNKIEGDFDITLDYSLVNWPDRNGTRFGIGIFARDEFLGKNKWYQQAERISSTRADSSFVNFPGDAYLVDSADDNIKGVLEARGSNGKLKIVRKGNFFRAFCREDGSWMNLYSAETVNGPVNFFAGAWNHDYCFSKREVKVSFDKPVIK